MGDAGGKKVETATTADGGFAFDGRPAGDYRLAIGSATFGEPFNGVAARRRLITPAIIIAYIWVWAGFAMVVIAAGLAAIPRDVLRGSPHRWRHEWQVFRPVTVPLLAPVLTVVFVTMLINVLKVFDIVISVARPRSGRRERDRGAMWRTSFGGVNDFGLGSAIAVFLFLLRDPDPGAQHPATSQEN